MRNGLNGQYLNFSSVKPARPRLGFVHRQLRPFHYVPHRVGRLFGGSATADHEVIGIVDDPCIETAFPAVYLPSSHRKHTSFS